MVLSERLKKWLHLYTWGISFGYSSKVYIREILDLQERFVLITSTGSRDWSGLGETSYYPANHWIVDTFKETSFTDSKQVSKPVEGRLTKEKKKELLSALEKYKKLERIE